MLESSSSEEKGAATPNEATIEQQGGTGHEEIKTLEAALGYKAELHRNSSMSALLFQSLVSLRFHMVKE
jgi:hypothetical protein